jgi:secreted pullulanase
MKTLFLACLSTTLVLFSGPVAEGRSYQPDWQKIDEEFAYAGDDLGCFYQGGSARIKVWAPRATQVTLELYEKTNQAKVLGRRPMRRGERGVWTVELQPGQPAGVKDWKGYYYRFEVVNPGREPRMVLDPYAKSMAPVTVSPDGQQTGTGGDFIGKAAIVDPAGVGVKLDHPVIPGYEKREDAVIWEMHVRDFTSDPAIAKDLQARWGSYRAFIDKLSYIKSLGVTHVQLLPIQAWYFGDETKMGERELSYSTRNNQYNWGYDPQNYFTPDGAYSEKPEDPESRIAEVKELIQAIHGAGMGVILDVVYTHMAKAEFLEDLVPDYYFFRTPQGAFLGDFGNNLATTRKMAEKLMIDSIKYWFSEFKIDGMRWDMMGDATAESVQRAYDAAAAINPKALFLGEGWRTFKGQQEDPALSGKGADQDWMSRTNSVGVFSDELRNELKSGFGCEGEPRFITGGARSIDLLFRNLKAQPSNIPADAPGDVVPYIEAHDNLPLYDVIAQSIHRDPDVPEHDEEIHRRIRLGNALLLTAQGTAFLHGGQEFGRTKQWRAPGKPEHKYHEVATADGKPLKYPFFVHDSYDSSDAVNRFDWAKATATASGPLANNYRTREFTRGLIAVRRSSDAFRLGSKDLIDKNVQLIAAPEIKGTDLVIAYSCRATTGETFHIFVNADKTLRTLSLTTDLTAGLVICDGETVNPAGVSGRSGFELAPDKISLDPLSVIIIKTP